MIHTYNSYLLLENNTHQYRFKTKDEFIKEFGMDWTLDVDWNDKMDYLFGKILDVHFPDTSLKIIIPNKNFKKSEYEKQSWSITRKMLVKIKTPSYKPKKNERDI